MEPLDRVNILIVDDTPEKLLTLGAALEELQQNVISARSGRDALRQVLKREFAVIILDINMPGMDGFETAELIRKHPSFRHTPIIFMTAFSDDLFQAKSYSLGAVDYLLTPFNPAVLRTKVSVFVELYCRAEQVRRQAEALERRAAQLHKLTSASIIINAALSLDAILRAITEAARDIIGAHQAMATAGLHGEQRRTVSSFSDKYASFQDHDEAVDELYRFACKSRRVTRLTQQEIDRHPAFLTSVKEGRRPPLVGFLAAPLTEKLGDNMGLIQLSDKIGGSFTEDDEALVVQLAQLGSIAIQNCLQAEAREANRLKDEFLATLSHELRTPLNAILGWTRLLQLGPRDPPRVARALEVIERNANAQTKLIEDLLDVARITSDKFQVTSELLSFAGVVEAAVDTLRPTAEAKEVTITSSLDSAGWMSGDPNRLHQAVVNVLSNAVKFTPKGGRVEVSLRGAKGHVELYIRDSGEGISQEFLPFVFERFRQADTSTRKVHGGLGIGLAVVRHIIELHGGGVSAESAGRGQGATVRMRLPLVADPQKAGDEGAPEQVSAPASRERSAVVAGLSVLLVEDDADTRQVLTEILSESRVVVTAVSSAREALDSLDRQLPDVLISDIGLPGEDGYELLRRVRARAPEAGGQVPAIALTAYTSNEDRHRAESAGFQMHLAKPATPEELIEAVAKLAEGSAAIRRMARLGP